VATVVAVLVVIPSRTTSAAQHGDSHHASQTPAQATAQGTETGEHAMKHCMCTAATSGETDARLETLVAEMAQLQGEARIDAMARLLTALAAEHSAQRPKAAQAHTMKGHGEGKGAMSCGMMGAAAPAEATAHSSGATAHLSKEELERADP
jgi:hypothetical protein